jgi:hypothetical protein
MSSSAEISGLYSPVLTFRSTAVFVAGAIDLAIGVAVIACGVILATHHSRGSLPLGLTVCLVGLYLVLTGLGRTTARLQVGHEEISWRWNFSTHRVQVHDLEDAALVEKGAPAPGASWAGFLGSGLIGVLAWWLLDIVVTVFSSEPSLGSHDLWLMKHTGAPLEVKPISARGTRSSHSQANVALTQVKILIADHGHRSHQNPVLTDDAWDSATLRNGRTS